MKALTDKIIESLQSRYDAVIFNEKTENEFSSIAFKEGLHVAIEEIKALEKECCFEEAARVLMKHLNNPLKYHPHYTAVVNSTSAELLESQFFTGKVLDYVD
ncbi:MAG: hypothetical protein BWX61_01151 [Bacteroidetes bacterium ADurb.Bin035]|nr:MAG: hypothetical protein BWX61_01151 [Bacteroidetes bacterium ADurb.Bin035]